MPSLATFICTRPDELTCDRNCLKTGEDGLLLSCNACNKTASNGDIFPCKDRRAHFPKAEHRLARTAHPVEGNTPRLEEQGQLQFQDAAVECQGAWQIAHRQMRLEEAADWNHEGFAGGALRGHHVPYIILQGEYMCVAGLHGKMPSTEATVRLRAPERESFPVDGGR